MAFDIVQNLKNLKNLPKVWKVLNFDEVIEDNTRNAEKIQKNDYLENGKIAIVDQGQNLIAGYSNDEENAYCKYPLIIFGDHTRILKYIDFPIYLGADGTKLLDIKEEVADTKYVYYFLNTLNIPSTGYNRHFKYLKDVQIPLPPLNIQKKIADTLDKAQEIIDKRKEQISSLDKFLENSFLDMFGDPVSNPKGWEIRKLFEVAKINMGQSPLGESYNFEGLGEPLLNGPTEFGKKYPKEKQWTTQPRKFSEKGDILFCVRGPTAGRMNYADKVYCIGRGLAAISAKKIVSTSYIFLILQGMYKIFQTTSNGSTFINIDKTTLENINIPITPLDLQNQFASIVEKVETEKIKLEASLKEMEDNFNSIMQRAFKGELF